MFWSRIICASPRFGVLLAHFVIECVKALHLVAALDASPVADEQIALLFFGLQPRVSGHSLLAHCRTFRVDALKDHLPLFLHQDLQPQLPLQLLLAAVTRRPGQT